jgi:hypothetical protein
MKKPSFVAMALGIVFAVILFISYSVWAGEKPQLKFNGSTIIFPKEDKLTDLDISKFEFEKSTIPKELLFMFGKVYRGEFKNMSNPGATAYIMLTKGVGNYIFLYASFSTHYRGSYHSEIVCPSDILRRSDGFPCSEKVVTAKGTWRLYLKKGLPVLYANDSFEADFQEAGNKNVPNGTSMRASVVEPAPKKEPGRIKVENGFIVFPEDKMPDVKIKEDLKYSLSPEAPEEIVAIQTKIYGTRRPAGDKMNYLIPAGYDSQTKRIKLLYVTNNKGTQWDPIKILIDGIYSGSDGSPVKYVTDKSDKPWARLYILPEKQGFMLRLAWQTGGNADFFPVADLPMK